MAGRTTGPAEKSRRRFVHISFGIVTVLTIATLAVKTLRDGFSPGNAIILICFVAFFWYWAAKSRASKAAVVTGCILILLDLAGQLLNPWGYSFAGVTYDTYLHLLGGFVAMMLAGEYLSERLAPRWHPLAIAFGVTIILGLGLEVVELADQLLFSGTLFTPDCWRAFCPYWQDTIKDVINDALGAAFFWIAIQGRENRKE